MEDDLFLEIKKEKVQEVVTALKGLSALQAHTILGMVYTCIKDKQNEMIL